jgi:hypothetical protein
MFYTPPEGDAETNMLARSIVFALRVLTVVYVLAYFGLLASVPEYVDMLSWAVNTAAAVALIARFWPLSFGGGAHTIGPMDADLIVAAATIILTSSVFSAATNLRVAGDWLRWGRGAAARKGS